MWGYIGILQGIGSIVVYWGEGCKGARGARGGVLHGYIVTALHKAMHCCLLFLLRFCKQVF